MNDSSRMFTYPDPIGKDDTLTNAAVRYRDTGDLKALALFLHLFEPQINKVVNAAIKTYGQESLYEDIKLACALAIMDALPKFDPNRGKIGGFLRYPILHAAQEELRVMRSGFPISTKSTDPVLRKVMLLYHENDDRHDPEVLAEIVVFEENETDKKKKEDDYKDQYLLFKVRGNPEWEPENSLLQSEQSGLIVPAFAALPNVNRDIVSLHLGFCENCFRPAERQTFEALALRNGRRSAQAAENIYYRSLNQMREKLTERGFLHTVRLNRLKKTKAPAVLIETAFHDNPDDARWIRDNIDNIAMALAKSVAEYFGVEFRV